MTPAVTETKQIEAPPSQRLSRRLRGISHRVQYGGLLALAAAVRALPRPFALGVGAALGQLGWALGLRRRVVLANLEQALPSLSPLDRQQMAARSARNFGRTAIEFLRFAGVDRRRISKLVEIEGLDQLRGVVSKERGALIVTAHLGAWALYVTALAAKGIPVALLVGKQHNPRVDELIHSIPGDAVRFVSKGRSAPRRILGYLKSGVSVVLVADQHAGRHGILAPFLSREASTMGLPAAFVTKYGYPLILMAGHREAGGRHRVVLRSLEMPVSKEGPASRLEVTTRLNRGLGEAILAHPDQYFWYHRRWRASDALLSPG